MFINTIKKYSPQTLTDFIYPDSDAKDIVDAYVSGEADQPLILHGTSGTGKSLLQRLIPHAIEQRHPKLKKVKCADLKSADDIHDLYGRNKMFDHLFREDGQKFNYIIFEEFNITNKKIIDAMKIELDRSLGVDLTIISTNRFEKIDSGIASRSIDLELMPCEPTIFFPYAKKIFTQENIHIDDAKLMKCLDVTFIMNRDNRKYYQAIDKLFRQI